MHGARPEQRPAAGDEVLHRELEPEVEQQHDQPDGGEHRQILGPLDEHESRRVRAGDDPGRHEERDGRESDAPAETAEDPRRKERAAERD
jgi:hypothetical protein